MLYDCIPDILPYRELSDIENLLDELGFSYNEIEKFNDCIVVKFYKSALLNINMKVNQSNVKDWIINIRDLKKSYKNSEKNAVDSLNIMIKTARCIIPLSELHLLRRACPITLSSISTMSKTS